MTNQRLETSVEEKAMKLNLTEREGQQVREIATELSALMDLPEDPRIEQAAYDILHVFVVDGGMSVCEAIATLRSSLRLTLSRLAGQNRRH